MSRRRHLALLPLILAGAACRPRQPPARADNNAVLEQRAARLEQARQQPADSGRDRPIARWLLPMTLAEVSGLALNREDRLFAHNDERGRVFEIDYRRGVLVKDFMVGPRALLADFEGLTIVGDVFYLLASNGRIFEFREGNDGERVEYQIHDTRLGRECEFEGIAYDSTINSLIMACKHVGIRSLRNHLVIYRLRLDRDRGDRLSRIAIPEAQVIGGNGWKKFEPSDISVDPATRNYVIIASQQKGMVEITPSGAVVRSGSIPERPNMAEGLAITHDGLMIVSAEATEGPASISIYRRP